MRAGTMLKVYIADELGGGQGKLKEALEEPGSIKVLEYLEMQHRLSQRSAGWNRR